MDEGREEDDNYNDNDEDNYNEEQGGEELENLLYGYHISQLLRRSHGSPLSLISPHPYYLLE